MIRSIRFNLGAALGLLVAVGIFSFGTTLWTVRSQRADALVVNLAGTERYMSQRISKLVLLSAQRADAARYRPEIERGVANWEATFRALLDGGEVAYGDRTVRLPPTTDPAVRVQMARVWEEWQRFLPAARAVAETSPDHPAFARALADVESYSDIVLSEMDRAVGLYEAAAAARVARVEWIQIVFLLAGALIVVLVYLSIHYWILIPLALLNGRVGGLIGGDLTTPVPVVAENEVGSLATAFEVMRGLLWRRFTEQSALLDLSRDLLGVLDPQAIARAVFAAVREQLRSDAVSLLVIDPAGTHLELVAAEGWAEAHVGRLRLPLAPPDDSGTAWAVHTRAPVFEDHTRTDQPFQVPDAVREAGVLTCLSVPLLAEERVAGALVLDSLTPRAFTDDEVRLASLITNHAALALERARLFEEMRRHANELAALTHLSREITSVPDLEPVLGIIARSATELSASDASGVFALRPDGRLYVLASHGVGKAFIEAINAQGVLPGRGAIGRACTERRSVQIPDVLAEPGYPFLDLAEMEGIRAILVVPMLRGEEVSGGIVLWHRQPRLYTREEVAFLEAQAQQCVNAVENARLFEQARLFKEALNNSADAMMITDLQARILEINPAFERISGFSREETIGRNPSIIKSRHTTLEFYQQMWAQILSQGCWSGEIINRRKNGEEWDSWLTISTVKDGRGQPVAYVGINRDITAMKRLQREREMLFEAEVTRRAELAELYDLSRALADTPPDVEAILDLVTRRAVESLGITFARAALIENEDCVVRAAHPARLLDRDLEVGRRESAAANPFCQRVLEQNVPVVIHRGDPALTDLEREALFLGIAKTLCLVPLRVGERALGLLMLGEARRGEREPFTAEKVHLARSIGDQAASALHRAELFIQLEQAFLQTVLALASAVDAKDTYTADHAQRLVSMALAVGREMGMTLHELEDLRYGAILHDIGKIGVPDAILSKPSGLDAEEWEEIRRHPAIGAQILASVLRLAGAARIVRHHHDYYDGTGYPDGLAGEAIPLGARILSAVDAYTAMLDHRPYRGPRTQEEAVAELKRCSGTQFDPRVVEVLLRLIERGPIAG